MEEANPRLATMSSFPSLPTPRSHFDRLVHPFIECTATRFLLFHPPPLDYNLVQLQGCSRAARPPRRFASPLMYQGGGKPHNPPFRLPTFSNPSTSGNAISVPARHGSSSTHRTDATSASSSSSEQRGNSRRGGFSSGYGSSNYQSHPRALAPFRKPSSQGSHWNQGGAAAGNGFATTAPGNIDSYVNDFRDGQQPNWAGRKAEALQRDALGGGGAAPKAWERLDSIEADQERRKQEAADEAKALKETRERVKAQKEAHDLAKLNADEKKARAASRIHPSTASVAALPSACRTSSPSASNLQRRNNDKNEKIASAAEERQRKAQKETEDIDESDVEVQVKVSSSKKGKGKEPAREEYMEVR